MRHPTILKREHTALIVVDIQEKLVGSLPLYSELEPNILRLVRSLAALEIPILLTEQYPKGLGPTVTAIREALPAYEPIEKVSFSCCGAAGLLDKLNALEIQSVILAGMETHVCIQQTALDLIAAGFHVAIPADAVVSSRKTDWRFALERMREAGAVLSTGQSILFEMLIMAGTPEFKAVLPFLK